MGDVRTIVAYFTVDEDKAFNEAEGPMDYFCREAERMEESGISLDDAWIADSDADDDKEAYLVYLARFAVENLSTGNVHPMTYEEWSEKNEKYFAVVRWTTEDVILAAARQGVSLTNEQAEKWWRENELRFEERLTEEGCERLAYVNFKEV